MVNARPDSSPYTPLMRGPNPQNPPNHIGPGATRQPRPPLIMRSADESLILVPPSSGHLRLCVFPLFPPPLSCAVGVGVLPDRHRPWRPSLVKSAIYPGGKWFQLTTSTAYVPRFFPPFRPSPPSFRRCPTQPLLPLLLMTTTCVTNLTQSHALKADPPFRFLT